MACISSRAYGTVEAPPDPATLYARRKTIRRWSIIGLSTALLVAVVVVAAVSINHQKSSNGDGDAGAGSPANLATSVKAVCSATLYPSSCLTTLAPMLDTPHALDPAKLFHLSAEVAIAELSTVADRLQGMALNVNSGSMASLALDSCYELIDMAIDQLNSSVTSASSSGSASGNLADDLRSWMSAAITYQQTCIDAFDIVSEAPYLKEKVSLFLKNSTEYSSNTLAIFDQVYSFFGSVENAIGAGGGGFPSWLPTKDRKLLQSTSTDPRARADIVVAKDGTGRYRTIKAALASVPEKSKKRTVIYVKKGVYFENVRVEKNMWNVMIVGDGMGSTVISGNLNVVDGTPTFKTATLAAFGKGFIGRDLTFRNSAGAAKHQAVAMMSDSDQSAFYRCRFDAYQDTLYTHSLRQFYRDCEIYGTVDFIFGNAAAVLQSCTILPRPPIPGQQDTITAQGKVDPNQNTGISIHQCTVRPYGNLSGVKVYLGRPWKPYSTTVFMKSSLDKFIDPAGWLPWTGNSAPNTIFYAEYQNFGVGASTAKRVKWKGLRTMDVRQASRFTAGPFVGGDSWLPNAGVPYKSGL